MSSAAKIQGKMTVTGGYSNAKAFRLAKLYNLFEHECRRIKRARLPLTLNIGTKWMAVATAVGCTHINGVALAA